MQPGRPPLGPAMQIRRLVLAQLYASVAPSDDDSSQVSDKSFRPTFP